MRLLILCVLLACGAVVGAQEGRPFQRGGPPSQPRQQQPEVPKATLRGHVYSQETGQPLKRAELTLRPERGRGSETVSTLTDAQGGFEFRDVEPGTYDLRCTRSGHVTISYGQKDPRVAPPSLTVNPGQELKGLDFHLIRAGVISGTVVDEDGEPMADTEISALKRQYSNRRVRYEQAAAVTTDDRGNYRIFDLSPGRYVVLASYHQEAGGDGLRYGPVYYPGAGSPQDAQRIEVSGGSDVPSIDFRLRAVPTFSLSGRVVDTGTGQVVGAGRVSLVVNEGAGQRGGSSMIRPDGSFVIRRLFPGRYLMTIAAQGAFSVSGPISGGISDASGRRSDGRPMMRVFDMPAADVKDYVALIERPVSVRGKLILDGGQFAARGTRISLAPRSDQMISAVGQVSDDLSFEISSVAPGEYNVNIASRGGDPPFYVREVRVNGQDVSERGLLIGSAPPGLVEVVLDFNGGVVSGRILNDRDEVIAGGVALISSDPQRRSDDRYFRSGNAGQDGQFLIKAVVPGDYLLLAWPDGEAARVQDPEIFAQLEKLATRVRLEKNGAATQDLHLLDEVRALAQSSQ